MRLLHNSADCKRTEIKCALNYFICSRKWIKRDRNVITTDCAWFYCPLLHSEVSQYSGWPLFHVLSNITSASMIMIWLMHWQIGISNHCLFAVHLQYRIWRKTVACVIYVNRPLSLCRILIILAHAFVSDEIWILYKHFRLHEQWDKTIRRGIRGH